MAIIENDLLLDEQDRLRRVNGQGITSLLEGELPGMRIERAQSGSTGKTKNRGRGSGLGSSSSGSGGESEERIPPGVEAEGESGGGTSGGSSGGGSTGSDTGGGTIGGDTGGSTGGGGTGESSGGDTGGGSTGDDSGGDTGGGTDWTPVGISFGPEDLSGNNLGVLNTGPSYGGESHGRARTGPLRHDVRAPNYGQTPITITIGPGDIPLEDADFSAWDLECLENAYNSLNKLFMGDLSDEDPERKSIFSRKEFKDWLLSPMAYLISGLQKSGYINFKRFRYFHQPQWDRGDPADTEYTYSKYLNIERIKAGGNFWWEWLIDKPMPARDEKEKPFLDKERTKKMYLAYSRDRRYQSFGLINEQQSFGSGSTYRPLDSKNQKFSSWSLSEWMSKMSKVGEVIKKDGWRWWFEEFTRGNGWGELTWLLYDYYLCVEKKEKEKEERKRELDGILQDFGVGGAEGIGWAF